MLKAIHQHARFGQQMVDLNTVIIYYRMYPTLFRQKEQTDDNILLQSAISLKTILWMLLLLQLFARTLSSEVRNGADQTLHMTILFPLLDAAVKLASLRGR